MVGNIFQKWLLDFVTFGNPCIKVEPYIITTALALCVRIIKYLSLMIIYRTIYYYHDRYKGQTTPPARADWIIMGLESVYVVHVGLPVLDEASVIC